MNNEENDFDSENDTSSEKRTVKKNPSSGMTIRSAKRIWFSPRKSGRPNKDLSDKLQEAKNVLASAGEPLKRLLVRKNENKRPRGRPKSPQTTASIKEKRPRGRPRKNATTVDKPKRERGRPRKHPLVIDKPHRPRGRPRKNPSDNKNDPGEVKNL